MRKIARMAVDEAAGSAVGGGETDYPRTEGGLAVRAGTASHVLYFRSNPTPVTTPS